MLREAGFADIQADLTVLDYALPSPAARWADIAAGLEGLPLHDFAPETRQRLRVEHLAELEAVFAGGPLTVPIPLIAARGRRV